MSMDIQVAPVRSLLHDAASEFDELEAVRKNLDSQYEKAEANGFLNFDYAVADRRDALSQLLKVLDESALESGNYLIALDPRASAPLAQVAVGDLGYKRGHVYKQNVPGVLRRVQGAAGRNPGGYRRARRLDH